MPTETVDPTEVKFLELSRQAQRMVRAASQALQGSYHVYLGRFAFGAAVLTKTGRIITGSNVETPTAALSVCAERVALACAHAQGVGDACIAIAIVVDPIDPQMPHHSEPPCVLCREAIYAFALRSGVGGDFPIVMATTNFEEESVEITTIGALYPRPFEPPPRN